jgi:hypothetical protein
MNRGGPGKGRPNETPAAATRREPALSLTAGGGGGRCWRCGVPFAWTSLASLAFCTWLARHAGRGPYGGLDRAGWLALSDERDLALRLRHGYWREGYRLGREHGWRDGYEQARAEQEAAWQEVAAKIARSASAPSFAELERRRWGPGGREHFGDPRPGDYPGRGAGR